MLVYEKDEHLAKLRITSIRIFEVPSPLSPVFFGVFIDMKSIYKRMVLENTKVQIRNL